MKNFILIASVILSATFSFAQDCSDLFISEYLEGLGNNKALEIYNPTDNEINLGEYFVVRYSNGNSSPTVQNAIQLRGTIAPKSVHVGVIDKRDPDGEGQEAPIWSDLEEVADEFYCPIYDESNTFYWNGNDAVVLFKGVIPSGIPLVMPISSLSNIQPLDIFGKIGENPGEASQGGGWTYDGTPVAEGGVVVSANMFLVRKPEVKKGVSTPPSVFRPIEQWDTLSYFAYVLDENGDTIYNNQGLPARRMNTDNLGMHICECGDALATEVNSLPTFGFEIFPNPTANGRINLISTDDVEEITITNTIGEVVQYIPDAKSLMSIELNAKSGVYFLTAKERNGQTMTKKFIIK